MAVAPESSKQELLNAAHTMPRACAFSTATGVTGAARILPEAVQEQGRLYGRRNFSKDVANTACDRQPLRGDEPTQRLHNLVDWRRSLRSNRTSSRIPMTSTLTPATHRASFAIGDEQAARRVVDRPDRELFRGPGRDRRLRGRRAGAGTSRVHFAERRTRARSANWSPSPPAARSRRPSPSTPSRPRTGSRRAWKNWSRSAPGASSCTAGTTAPRSRPTSSASRSRRRWRSAPATTAPRAAACCCSITC